MDGLPIESIVFILCGAWLIFWSGPMLIAAEAEKLPKRWIYLRISIGLAFLFYALYVGRGYRL